MKDKYKEGEKKKDEMRNDNSISGANSSIDEMFVCIYRLHHKNTRNPIKKARIICTICLTFTVWQSVCPALVDRRLCSQTFRTDIIHVAYNKFSRSQGRFNRRPQSISLYFRTNSMVNIQAIACVYIQQKFHTLWFIVLSGSQKVSWDCVPFVS